MTKAELLELLLVERHLPVPAPPVVEPVFAPDTKENQRKRFRELERATYVPKKRKPKPPVRVIKAPADPAITWTPKGGIQIPVYDTKGAA